MGNAFVFRWRFVVVSSVRAGTAAELLLILLQKLERLLELTAELYRLLRCERCGVMGKRVGPWGTPGEPAEQPVWVMVKHDT